MTAELGTETIGDSETESERDVIEVTAEDVDAAAESVADKPGTEVETEAADGTNAERTADQTVGGAQAKIVYCVRCGGDMRFDDRFCRNCGWDSSYANATPPQPPPRTPLPPNTSDRNRLTALLLCVLLGWLGAHRFYLGKAGTGIIWLLTFGLLGAGVIFDLVMITTGECRDIDGRPVLRWD